MRVGKQTRISAPSAAVLLCLSAMPVKQADAAVDGEPTGTPGIRVVEATYDSGRLSIVGFATSDRTVEIPGTAFKARATPGRTFEFNLAYRTSDCTVTLATATGTLTVPVGNCTPGQIARGRWSPKASYRPGDVVVLGGEAWIALKPNQNSRPLASAKAADDWAPYAAGGERGLRGPQGRRGPAGEGFPRARIRSNFCHSQNDGIDDGFSETTFCVVACPAEQTAIGGWEWYYTEGPERRVADPRLLSDDWFGGSFAGQFAVLAPIYNEDWGASVAIACVPEIEPPIQPVPRFSD